MRLKGLALGLLLVIFTSCGHTWVIRQDKEGGTIGYQGYWSKTSEREAIEKQIHCKPWVNAIDFDSNRTHYTATQFSGPSTPRANTPSPVPQTAYHQSKEFSYYCVKK